MIAVYTSSPPHATQSLSEQHDHIPCHGNAKDRSKRGISTTGQSKSLVLDYDCETWVALVKSQAAKS